jgi:hypothetical protein
MGKLVVLTFAEGDLDKTGFPVTLQMGDEGKPATIQETGSLPPNPELIESYNSWKVTYYSFFGIKVRKLEAKVGQITNFSIGDVNKKADNLSQHFNQWLKSPQFSHVREELVAHLKEDDEVRLIIQTSNMALRKLPWHLWDILERYPKAEISVSAPNFRQVRLAKVANNQVKILAILGDDDGINVEADRKFLDSIPGAKVKFLVKPNRQELNDLLWEQSWDILFFAGHSRTDGEIGILYINKTESLTIPDLRYALKKAIKKGLQLAIFNSCDGLGLAQDLADLNLPQMIVMREPVPDKVAQEFFKYFLGYFLRCQSLYLAVKDARERLQGWESQFPCASWLPVICQSRPETNNLCLNIPNRFKSSKTQNWIAVGLCIFSLFSMSLVLWQDQVIKTALESLLTKSQDQKSDPKNTILQYYKLATTNRKAAIQLLSDPLTQKEAEIVNDSSSFWGSVSKVEVDSFSTLAKSNSNATIRVWLKYYIKSGETSCESENVKLIFDPNRNQWLIEQVSNVEIRSCDNRGAP